MATMNTSKPIQIFKPGKHVAMSGAALSFSETDLSATASAYDPDKHEAPLVCGHPRHDDPAYGWVGKLSFAEGVLEAAPVQVNTDFAELVASGAFKKISASFYAPDSPSNPVPGVYYLRHVGFLGAQPPAVKGLRNPSFADSEQGIVEFADWDDMQNAGLWRSMREWIIGKFGLDEADKVIPGYTVTSLEQSAASESDDDEVQPATPAFADPVINPEGDTMSAEDKARLAELEAENTRLKNEQAAFAEAEKSRSSAVRHTEHVAFCESLIAAGKLLPVNKEVTIATLDHLSGQEQVVEFGEGDAKKPLVDAYKAQLQAAQPVVHFGESAAADKTVQGNTVEFAAPGGYTVDAERLELHHKALTYQAQNKTTYEAALTAVSA